MIFVSKGTAEGGRKNLPSRAKLRYQLERHDAREYQVVRRRNQSNGLLGADSAHVRLLTRMGGIFHRLLARFRECGATSSSTGTGGQPRPRVLLLADSRQGAFEAPAQALAQYLRDEFECRIAYVSDKPDLRRWPFDLIYVSSWGETHHQAFVSDHCRVIKAIDNHTWARKGESKGFSPRQAAERHLAEAGTLTASTRLLQAAVAPYREVFHTPTGFEPAHFFFKKSRRGPLRIGWTGDENDPGNGVNDILRPAAGKDFEFVVAGAKLSRRQKLEFYNSIDVLCVASTAESEPPGLMEGLACGCFPVTVQVGIVPELIPHREKGWIVPREAAAFQEAFRWCAQNLEQVRAVGRWHSEEMRRVRSWERASRYWRFPLRAAWHSLRQPDGGSRASLLIPVGAGKPTSDASERLTAASVETKPAEPLPSLEKNYITISPEDLGRLRSSLERHCFAQYSTAFFASEAGQADLHNHLSARLEGFRRKVVPWLNEVRPLKGSRILEIGCGTGSSTVSLAEQGAEVVGVDIEPASLTVAQDRCRLYGLNRVEFVCANATEASQVFRERNFDFIIFFATLEHMTHEERMVAMKDTWDMLDPGGCWSIIETPNRLWYYDSHTSLMPFHLWLPDELAFECARFSPRANYREIYDRLTPERLSHFLRRGRGLSYHEFELTIDTLEKLPVVSSLSEFLRARSSPAKNEQYLKSVECEYKALLRKVGPPRLHGGFYEPYLDLILKKSVRHGPRLPKPKPHETMSGTPQSPVPVGGDAPTAVHAHTGRFPVPKRRVLLIADVPDWIFARHCKMLERFLGEEFEFTTQYMGRPIRESDFDLIYPLEFNLVPAEQITQPGKWVTGLRSHTAWQNGDFLELVKLLATRFQCVHAVSRRLQHILEPFLPSVEYVTHGVDTDFFTARTRSDQSGRRLRLGWAGSRMNPTKGFNEFIAPLGRLPGVELVFCGHLDVNLKLEGMRDFYDSLDAYICASLFEGNNNSLLEAAAMQRAIITTDNGTVPEYLRHGESALIVERTLADFTSAVLELRDNPAKRAALGESARTEVAAKFEWKAMAEQYRALFRAALANREVWRPFDLPLSRKIEAPSTGFQ